MWYVELGLRRTATNCMLGLRSCWRKEDSISESSSPIVFNCKRGLTEGWRNPSERFGSWRRNLSSWCVLILTHWPPCLWIEGYGKHDRRLGANKARCCQYHREILWLSWPCAIVSCYHLFEYVLSGAVQLKDRLKSATDRKAAHTM